MKFSPALFASTLGITAGIVQADYVDLCNALAYADGAIYCRGPTGSCGSDLGDFPAQVKFPVQLTRGSAATNTVWESFHLAKLTSSRTYESYDDVLYLNAAPGAFAPVGFKDPSKLTGTETSKYWTGGYGLYIWSPTSTGQGAQGGFQWVSVPGYSDLKQLYWNETFYQSNVRTYGTSLVNSLSFCYGDYDATIIRKAHP